MLYIYTYIYIHISNINKEINTKLPEDDLIEDRNMLECFLKCFKCFYYNLKTNTYLYEKVHVTSISNPWWCKQKNQSMNKATRQKVLKIKFQILSHQ